MTKSEFKKLELSAKYKIVDKGGSYIAHRYHGSYQIELYSMEDFLVEVWKRIGINNINWIEVVSDDILDKYVKEIELKF